MNKNNPLNYSFRKNFHPRRTAIDYDRQPFYSFFIFSRCTSNSPISWPIVWLTMVEYS